MDSVLLVLFMCFTSPWLSFQHLTAVHSLVLIGLHFARININAGRVSVQSSYYVYHKGGCFQSYGRWV